jgi:pilus assembly protein CpaC
MKAVGAGILFLSALLTASANAAEVEIIPEAGKVLRLEASKGLLIRLDRAASAVFIADPEIADIQVKSPRLVYLLGKRSGETTLYAVDEREEVLANQRILVEHDISRLRDSLRTMLPGSAIRVQSVNSNIVLTGMVRTPSDSEDARRLASAITADPKKVINNIDVSAPAQVQLRVRVAEVSRDVLKTFGINWEATFQAGSFLFGLATGNPIVAAATAGGLFGSRPTGSNAIAGRFSNGKLDVNGLIDALDDQGLITVLAEPNLTAISGKSATFLAGGEFPIVVPGQSNQTTVEFKKFGVQLAFTPTIVGADRISLHVAPEVSQLSAAGAVQHAGFQIPALTTRRAETTVELGSGQSFAVAGLMQNNITHNLNKFPGLGDVPVLGTLFRSDRFQRNESELVIIVTPYLVRPVSTQLTTPADGFVPPTDTDRLLRGEMYRPSYERNDEQPVVGAARGPSAPIGFSLD